MLIYLTCLLWTTLVAAQPNQWSRDSGSYRPRVVDPNVCSTENCRLPKCFCAGKEAPLRMDPSVIPQIVMFTFDDAVNEQVMDYFTELFPPERVNPNGCPVTVTFFLSHNWTDYNMVKSLYDRGHEIASHSITHRMPQSWWRYAKNDEWTTEIEGQRNNIIEQAGIPRQAVTGMRAPFLDTGGDEMFNMLTENGFNYDASVMTGPHDKGGAWPFTLDFVPNWQYCSNLNCPKNRHPGLWEVPLNRWVGPDGNGCSMVDSCQQQPGHKGQALAYLWQNFNKHYYGNRSPVGVNMHANWFETAHHYDAMKEFVKTISEMDDVYLVTVQQTLAWMRSPQTIDRAIKFAPWLKSCSILQQGNIPVRRVSTNVDNRPTPDVNPPLPTRGRPLNRNRDRLNSAPNVQIEELEANDIDSPSRNFMYDSDVNVAVYSDEYFAVRRNSAVDSDDTGSNTNVMRNNNLRPEVNNNAINGELFYAGGPELQVDQSKEKPFRNGNVASLDNSLSKDSTDRYEYYDESDEMTKGTSPVTPAKKLPIRPTNRAGQRPPNAALNTVGRRPRPARPENQATRQQRVARKNSAHMAHANNALIASALALVLAQIVKSS